MANKPNPLIAALEAKLEAQHQARLRVYSEMDRMALLISAHRRLGVGPGRSPGLLHEHTKVKLEIATLIEADIGDSYKKGGDGDPEFLRTRRDLAVTLKGILGPEAWEEDKHHFPMLQEYWDV